MTENSRDHLFKWLVSGTGGEDDEWPVSIPISSIFPLCPKRHCLNSYSVSSDLLVIGPEPTLDYPLDNPFDSLQSS